MGIEFQAKAIIPGYAQGTALVSSEPLSFWGGYDFKTGEIIDRRHPLSGQIAAGRILVLPYSRGSSTTTAVLLESIKAGTAPAAILTTSIDSFFALASIVANELYCKQVPILALQKDDFDRIQTGTWLYISIDGVVSIRSDIR